MLSRLFCCFIARDKPRLDILAALTVMKQLNILIDLCCPSPVRTSTHLPRLLVSLNTATPSLHPTPANTGSPKPSKTPLIYRSSPNLRMFNSSAWPLTTADVLKL